MAKVDEVLSEFEQIHGDVLQAVRDCPDDRWEAETEAEGWPVGMVAKHIGLGYLQGRSWIRTMAAGEPVTMAMDDIHSANARNRGQKPDSRAATEEFLQTAYSKFVETARGLSDEQLERSVHFGPREAEARVADVMALTPRHTRGHLQSIRNTLARAVA